MAKEVLRLTVMTSLSARIFPAVQDPESELIARLRDRDPAALTELYDIYGRSVFSLLVRMVRDKGIAEDLTQDTFLRIWLRAALFDCHRGAAGQWVMTIARNRAIDHLRSRQAWCFPAGEHFVDTEDPRLFAALERDVRVSQSRPTLNAALQSLPANQRAAIELAYVEGFTQSEIADRLGHPLGTVKTWVRSALGSLRDYFEGSEGNWRPIGAPEKVVAIDVYRAGSEGI